MLCKVSVFPWLYGGNQVTQFMWKPTACNLGGPQLNTGIMAVVPSWGEANALEVTNEKYGRYHPRVDHALHVTRWTWAETWSYHRAQ